MEKKYFDAGNDNDFDFSLIKLLKPVEVEYCDRCFHFNPQTMRLNSIEYLSWIEELPAMKVWLHNR
jgi:hypothetical protein